MNEKYVVCCGIWYEAVYVASSMYDALTFINEAYGDADSAFDDNVVIRHGSETFGINEVYDFMCDYVSKG